MGLIFLNLNYKIFRSEATTQSANIRIFNTEVIRQLTLNSVHRLSRV